MQLQVMTMLIQTRQELIELQNKTIADYFIIIDANDLKIAELQKQPECRRLATAPSIAQPECGTSRGEQAPAPVDAVAHSVQAIAAATVGPGPEALALVKREVGAMPNEQQLQYWRLADQPFDATELRQLVERYLTPRLVTRGYNESRSGRQRDVLKQGPPAVAMYEKIAPVLLQLWQQVQEDSVTAGAAAVATKKRQVLAAASSSAASEYSASAATKSLLRALRTLKLWETRQNTQPQMPQALECLVPKQPSNTATTSAAAADVQEVTDLTGDDDMDDEGSEQMQQFLAGQLEYVLMRELRSSKLDGGSAGAKRIKLEPVVDVG